MRDGRYLRLGDMLVQRGSLSAKKLERGLTVASQSKQRLGDVLVDLGYVSEDEIAQCLAEQYGFEFEDLSEAHPNPSALEKLTPDFALKWSVLPLELTARFKCVVADPLDIDLADTLTAIVRRPISCSLASKSALQKAIRLAYGLPQSKAHDSRKRRPKTEAVMQRDREMLLEAIDGGLANETNLRRAS
jgi:type IV pilus assembly protein PilB